MWRSSLLGVALILWANAASAAEFEFSGPLRFADQFPITVVALAVEPLPLELLGAGAWQAELAVSAGNTFTRSRPVQRALEARTDRLPVTREFLQQADLETETGEPVFYIDGETLRTELRLRRGLRRGLELEVRIPFVQRHGGGMDTFLEELHNTLGLDQDGRLGVPKHGQGLVLTLPDRELELTPESSFTLADPLVAVRGERPLPRAGQRVTWDVAVKIPVADEGRLSSSGSVDLAAQAQWSACSARRCAFAALNLRHLGAWRELGLSSRLVPGGYVGLEQRWLGLSWLAQLLVASSALDGIGIDDLDADTWQLSLGLHKRLGQAYAITAAVTENAVHFDNGPDIAVHLALRRVF